MFNYLLIAVNIQQKLPQKCPFYLIHKKCALKKKNKYIIDCFSFCYRKSVGDIYYQFHIFLKNALQSVEN